jgi:Transglutaminase-like enzymes, putative cysteine proteases
MRNAIITSLFLFFATVILGQPAKEFAVLKVKYPDQPAVYTQRSTVVEIFNSTKDGFSMEVKDHDELFILADDALPFAPGVEYFNATYNIQKIRAYTLIPTEKKYRLMEVKDFKKTSEMSDNVFFDDQQSYKYTYPAVCKGAKLVEETTTHTIKPENPISFYFGMSLPTSEASLTLTFPEDVKISYKLFGNDTTLIQTNKTKKGKSWIYVWKAKEMKSYTGEQDGPSVQYYLPHILVNIASYTSNSATLPVNGSLNNLYHLNYSKIAGVNDKISPTIKALADSISQNGKTEQEKVALIYQWVQMNIRYVAIEDGDNGYIPRQAMQVLERRYGDCKDKTSLLQALISSIGADISFAWIGTRSLPYKYSEFAGTNVDNHMIAVYRSPQKKTYFLDGTTRYFPMGLNPSGIQGKECLVARGPDKFDLLEVPISSPETNIIIDSVWVHIEHDTLAGHGLTYLCGESKTDLIAAFVNSETKDYPKMFSQFLPKPTNKFSINSINFSRLENTKDTLKVTYAFTFPNYISNHNDKYYINLNLDRLYQDATIKPNREIPIEIEYPLERISVCTVSIPDNYESPILPEPISFTDSLFEFSVSYNLSKRAITLTKNVKMYPLLIYPKSFENYRTFLNKLNSAYMQTIVFRKI